MKKIWIDCDPGHDDALAILVALANPEQLQVLGVSTIGGNSPLENVTNNAKNLLNLLGAQVPLIKGQAGQLVKELQSAPEAHGETGMAGLEFPDNDYPILEVNLLQYMFETIMANPEKVDIVAIGPLTNIALLLKAYPEVKTRINQICLMGGGIDHGNYSPAAEFNFYVDPEAAQIVLNAGVKVVMAGLDVTEKSYVTREEIDTLQTKGPISRKIYQLLDFYNVSGRQFGFKDSPLHDLCTVVYLLDPTTFTGEIQSVSVATEEGVARGMSIADTRKQPEWRNRILVLKNSNREKYVKYLMDGLEYFDHHVG
ncbi:ribonucleoside hydrolase [Pediococcus acidilactici]|uniref:nucleoside hydrolase n=1 Tax=Pediococcus acidilactici TaxID=1254 RepID=UPI000878055B|nr:nucleoside hydrolase [Pediococcus acidilactici]AOW74878.1 ribonucleoside hydrolase [Pediococcus acidilactici]